MGARFGAYHGLARLEAFHGTPQGELARAIGCADTPRLSA